MNHDDPELRTRFEQLRRHEAAQAPEFAHTLARAKAVASTRSPLARWRWALVAFAVAGSLWLALPLAPDTPQGDPSAWRPGRWAMPTDVLLEVPGSELLHDLPDIVIPREPATSLRRQSTRRTPV